MKRLMLYADYKHDSNEEYMNILLDTELNDKAKDVLFNCISDYINNTFDLTYVDNSLSYITSFDSKDKEVKFILTRREFDFMLTKEYYSFGDIDDTYLFPTGVTVKIIKDESISLKQLMLQQS